MRTLDRVQWGMENVTHILQQHFHIANWTIKRPKDGMQKACYVAQSGGQRVFVKFDVPIESLQRLGEIEVAPRVLASGIVEGRSYVVQEYISGSYPNWRWFAGHLPLLARFAQRYHFDAQLTALLAKVAKTVDYAEHIALDIAELESQLLLPSAEELHTLEIIRAFDALKVQAKDLQAIEFVPIHADPNTKNILLEGGTLRMVDWDDMRLSDPMQDVGLLLWWYVAKEQWQEFFQNYGLVMDEQVEDRIFWWAARSSLAIALWHVAHAFGCQPFLEDFMAAVRKESNPHAVFG